MKSRRFKQIAISLLASLWLATGMASVAMITDLRGTATLEASGEQSQADILSYLEPGDSVTLTQGASLTLVYFEGAKEYQFQGPATITVGETAPSGGAGGKTRDLSLGATAQGIAAAGQQYAQAALVLRNVNKAKPITPLYPKNSLVAPNAIRFAWEPVSGVREYELVLSNDFGEPVFNGRTADNHLILPEPLGLPAGSRLSWKVSSVDPTVKAASSKTRFELAKAGEVEKEIGALPGASAPISEQVLYATVLEQRGLADQAAKLWARIKAKRPSSGALQGK
ncbi:MAG: hypothetical protein ACPG4N_04000 [Gammaproteobacteria bacterium]